MDVTQSSGFFVCTRKALWTASLNVYRISVKVEIGQPFGSGSVRDTSRNGNLRTLQGDNPLDFLSTQSTFPCPSEDATVHRANDRSYR